MTGTAAYLLAVLPVTAVVLGATWPPRWWHVALLAAGPALTALAVAGVAPFDRLGWIATVGVAVAFLLVPPILPWRRRWARSAVPAVVLAVSGALVALAGGEPAVALYLAPPVLVALGALGVHAVNRHADARQERARTGA